MSVHTVLRRHKFPVAILLVVGVTLVLTTISMAWYVTSGTSGLDLSRPGLDKERQNVKKDTIPNFSASGELDETVYQQFITLYTKEHENSKALGDFSEDVLSDKALGLDEKSTE